MGKQADRYLRVDPWEVAEEGFEPERGRVSESIFSLGNEYMGVRGYFDEGYGGDSLKGCYLNGVFESGRAAQGAHYKGLISRTCYMVNTVDWLYTRISIDEEALDIAKGGISNFKRTLDMKRGLLTREFTWETGSGKRVEFRFERFLSMVHPKLGLQRIRLKALNFTGKVCIRSGLDFSMPHEMQGRNLWNCLKKGFGSKSAAIMCRTLTSGHMIFSSMRLDIPEGTALKPIEEEKFTGFDFELDLTAGMETAFDKLVLNHAEKEALNDPGKVWSEGAAEAAGFDGTTFDGALEEQVGYWSDAWEKSDIIIEGDVENQQGIRYCIFQMHQTYHGEDPSLNIGAKGLTGEAYNGNAFWDTETYCLPFYIFNNPKAARNLLEYRYRTLPRAVERAAELDCKGAFYPIATLDGSECCGLWQHASLQLQASTAVAYGIWHYQQLIGDRAFLYEKGAEMLLQICRMLASRGQWGQKTGKFGYYAVMGPDEFQMMVNNNCYTNLMARKTFEYTLSLIEEMAEKAPEQLTGVFNRIGLAPEEPEAWRNMAKNMYIPYDDKMGLYEQHDGFYNLPHIDIHSIPVNEFPLYNNWSYDRIYRNDMIKQPDVLMFMFLYNSDFSFRVKKANYEFYEPRCIHESSLSPSIHSIFASELGRHDEAFDFFGFATRMDLDNYNRNTGEGLHTTSIAAAWMNIVYGFGGMRSDGEMLSFKPSIPKTWKSYSFRILYKGALLKVTVDTGYATFNSLNNTGVSICVNGRVYKVGTDGGVRVELGN